MPTIQEIMDKKRAFEAELREFGKEALKAEFKRVFDAHPNIVSILWRQYTPFFNDGDPCEFGVNDMDAKFTDTPPDASGGYDDEGYEYSYGTARDSTKAAWESINGLNRIDDEIFEACFGDHCKVTATRDGFEVEEYEHD